MTVRKDGKNRESLIILICYMFGIVLAHISIKGKCIMDFNEQKKGIVIGVVLTVMSFYTFNCLFSPQISKQQGKIEQTHANKLLNEPLGLYTGSENIRDKTPHNRKKRTARKKDKAHNKNAIAETRKNEIHATKDNEKKEDKQEEEKTEEDNENTDIDTDNSYLAKEQYNNESPESSGIAGISGSIYTAYTSEGNNNTGELDTIEEWLAYFVAGDLSSIEKFTNAYLSQKISRDLFYSVIEELLTNFRASLKRYGSIALNKTPSPESFEHLVHITESNHHEQEVQNRAIKAFNTYTHIDRVSIIIDILSSPKDDVKLKAIQVAVDSAQSNLRPSNNLVSQESRQRQRVSSQENNMDKYKNIKNKAFYESLKSRLENLAQQDHNSTVRDQAEQAVNTINELLQQFS